MDSIVPDTAKRLVIVGWGLIGCLAKIKSIFNKFLLLKKCSLHDCESTAVLLIRNRTIPTQQADKTKREENKKKTGIGYWGCCEGC